MKTHMPTNIIDKVLLTIASCETTDQLDVAINMASNAIAQYRSIKALVKFERGIAIMQYKIRTGPSARPIFI
jgi:hypothetical protein